ncbi:uncharacterized protein BDW47DRAFT_105752 [Aspergillus candidus]|uniref:Uncharacterized protein n=1 Tax=Aspergillus candidus TaxID=41067 RepID=A0A2I2FBS0_ASPCN|nr:hypothetical protein BDW47DRAFT_105752 [Aspergillus candidus]PLB38057.1 hypothetical protein BDW47DRAFT_105752 [Aspergillus candidus]
MDRLVKKYVRVRGTVWYIQRHNATLGGLCTDRYHQHHPPPIPPGSLLMVSLHNCPGRKPNSYPGLQLTCFCDLSHSLAYEFLLITEGLWELSTEYVWISYHMEEAERGEMKVSRRSSARRRNVSGGVLEWRESSGGWSFLSPVPFDLLLVFPLFLFLVC